MTLFARAAEDATFLNRLARLAEPTTTMAEGGGDGGDANDVVVRSAASSTRT